MRKLIWRIWFIFFVIVGVATFPTEKAKKFFKENDSVDSIWAKLSKPCPACEQQTCYHSDDMGSTWQNVDASKDAYERGQKDSYDDMIAKLVQFRTARIQYQGVSYRVTVIEGN